MMCYLWVRIKYANYHKKFYSTTTRKKRKKEKKLKAH